MPEAVNSPASGRVSRLTLNTDGQPHPVLNAFVAFTLVGGIVAFAISPMVAAHLAATVVGIAAMAAGFGAQLNSATREQRIVIMTGIIAAFVGIGLGVAHGGFG